MPEKALNELLIAIALKPENDLININLSVFYQRQKEYKKSEGILKHLISKKPQDASLYFRLGVLYKDMGQYEAAVSELIKATQLAPEIINPYEELGNIYVSKIGDSEKGAYYYKKGIESAPKARLAVDDLRWMIQDLECYK
jgi:tetratricopeptide (TPR) repeat protein